MTPILLVRHPCAFVSSMLRGAAKGIMPRVLRLGPMAATRSAVRLGVSSLDGADDVTLLAWHWAISHAEAAPAIERAGGQVVIYEEIASNPKERVPQLFDRLALGWPKQTAEFLSRSQQSDGGYYSIFRQPSDVVRWKDDLDSATIAKIRSIVGHDGLGRRFVWD